MRLVAIKDTFFNICEFDKELLMNKAKRPYLLILRLKYKNSNVNFAIPFRSNLSATTPQGTYFPLPPRSTTRDGRKHGLHYIKMFPISNAFYDKYHIFTKYDKMLVDMINRKKKTIIAECQQYLINYENGKRENFATNIDEILSALRKDGYISSE